MLFVGNEPIRKTRGSVGFDLIADHPVGILPNKSAVIRTGTKVAIPFGYFGLISLRSGKGFNDDLLCHIGLIDSDYRGEIKVKVFNVSERLISIERGERFAQLTVLNYPFMYPMRVGSLEETERGENGFGSTGVK